MGKGNRKRNENAAAVLAGTAPRKAAKRKQGMPTWVGTLIVVAVLVVLVLIATLSVLSSRGTFLRMRTVASTENYEVTVPMMSYMVYTEYQNLVSMYNQYTSGSGNIQIGGGEGGDALDTSKPLRQQTYSVVTGPNGETVTTTWFDYFASMAEADVRQVLACCEAAFGNMELGDEEKAAIQSELDMMETYAATYGYTTNGYLSLMYGKGVLLKDVRAMMELTQLASKWSTSKQDQFMDEATLERINAHYEANKSTYDVYCDYMGFKFETVFTPSTNTDTTAAAEENAAAGKQYNAEKKLMADAVADLITATNESEFTGKLKQWLLELEKLRKAYELKKEVSELTAEEITACDAAANDKVTAATVKNAAKNEGDTDLDSWLFESKEEGEEKTTVYQRKPNEVKKFETAANLVEEGDNAYQKVTSTYSAYMFLSGMHRDESQVRSVGHILFKSETFDGKTSSSTYTGVIKEMADKLLARDGTLTAYAMAGELLDTLKAQGKITEVVEGEKTYYVIDEAVFEEYGELYTEDSSVFYDDVAKGQMVAEYENWLFDAKRVKNEISYPEPVKTSYGYHIMFYRGNENAAWYVSVKNDLVSGDHSAYLESIQETYAVTINAKNWSYVQ